MSVRFDGSGFERLKRNAEALEGERQVKFLDLFNPEFMRSKTRFSTFEDLLAAASIPESTFGEMSDADKDTMTRTHTTFGTWQAFVNAAGIEYAKKQLFK